MAEVDEFKLESTDSEPQEDDKAIESKPKEEKPPKSQKASSLAKDPEARTKPKEKLARPTKSPAKTAPAVVISESSAAEIAKSVSASVKEEDIPEWLSTNLRDANQRRPGEGGYDATTVFVPPQEEALFTPFQKQYWEIKRRNFDAIVMIRKGKFFEMNSVDALFARDVLKLHLTWRGREPMCGVPDRAFTEWAIKIINAGRRLCKVEQVETAIDQRNRKDGGKAIQRELVQAYSLGTIDDLEMLESSQPSYLLSLRSSGRSCAGVCLVDCSTGCFYMGVVDEDDLADTLIRFEPVEVIYNADMVSEEHLDIIRHMSGNVIRGFKGGIECWDGSLAMNFIQRIAGWEELPESLLKMDKEAIAAFGGCVAYLNDHKIAGPLLSLRRFKALNEAGSGDHLVLDSSALVNLQIIGKDEHCLLSILDLCVTSFGKRRLRFWVIHPLRNRRQIEERQNSIEELMGNDFINIGKRMNGIPDLERILARVYSNRCTIRVFVDCLNGLKKVGHFFASLENDIKSNLLKAHVHPVGKGDQIERQIDGILNQLELEKSLDTNEFVVKGGVYADIDAIDGEVGRIEEEFVQYLCAIRTELRCREIEFQNLQSDKYLLVIPARFTDNLDSRFILMSKTKAVSRYHTPQIQSMLRRLEDVENERLKLRSQSQKQFLDDFTAKSVLWDSLVESCADIDCLVSISSACKRWRSSDLCRPRFIEKGSDSNAVLNLRKMRHPCLRENPIPNDADIGARFVLLITGPNASGKSTYARMCCVAIVLAQIGCFLPAEAATLTVFDQIFTRIGASDRLFSGQSTFAVELAETARLTKNATSDSFVVLDELGRGTSTFDGIAIAGSVLSYFVDKIRCPLVFCTHYHVLAEQFAHCDVLRNVSMKFEVRGKLHLLYEVVDGMCDNSFGCQVARICGLPDDLTEEAQNVADDFERRHAGIHVSAQNVKVLALDQRDDLKRVVDDLIAAFDSSSKLFERINRLNPILHEIIPAIQLPPTVATSLQP
jgi:DNA mismatch repair protein MSH6